MLYFYRMCYSRDVVSVLDSLQEGYEEVKYEFYGGLSGGQAIIDTDKKIIYVLNLKPSSTDEVLSYSNGKYADFELVNTNYFQIEFYEEVVE